MFLVLFQIFLKIRIKTFKSGLILETGRPGGADWENAVSEVKILARLYFLEIFCGKTICCLHLLTSKKLFVWIKGQIQAGDHSGPLRVLLLSTSYFLRRRNFAFACFLVRLHVLVFFGPPIQFHGRISERAQNIQNIQIVPEHLFPIFQRGASPPRIERKTNMSRYEWNAFIYRLHIFPSGLFTNKI
jgi:hypothetical protein